MRRSGWPLLVVTSFLLTLGASAATRPQYGGTLRVTTHIAPVSLDPTDSSQPDSIARRNLLSLLYDTLVVMDNAGRIRPALATSWQVESTNQRWQFFLRQDVEFQDSSPLRADAIAASLRSNNPGWTIYPTGNSVVIECKTPEPNLPAELALSRNAIAKRTPMGTIFGTGPFQVAEWQPGKKLMLTAQEGYWGGRPFVDSIVIELGKSSRDQLIALDLGKADVVEVGPEQARRFAMQSRNLASSAPAELISLVFTHAAEGAEQAKLREALALSIDRATIRNVLFQGQGDIAGGILPDWMSGYEFVFPATMDSQRAQQIDGELRQASAWSVGYDPADPLARLVAERISLNARDAGLTLHPTGSSSADLRVARALLPTTDPRLALAAAATALGLASPASSSNSVEDLFKAESALLQTKQIIPLLHLPSAAYATSPLVKGFVVDRDGAWHLSDVWIGTAP